MEKACRFKMKTKKSFLLKTENEKLEETAEKVLDESTMNTSGMEVATAETVTREPVKAKADNQSVQTVISKRTLDRQKIILDYLTKHRICTIYEITKEIRTQEHEQGLMYEKKEKKFF